MAEHQRLVAAGDELKSHLLIFLHLGADDADLGRHQSRAALCAAQAGQHWQHVESGLATAGVRGHLRHAFECATPCCFEEAALLRAGFGAVDDLGALTLICSAPLFILNPAVTPSPAAKAMA